MEHDLGAVVIDVGSAVLKAGFAGENLPRCIMSPQVGRPRHRDSLCPWRSGQSFVGEDVSANRGLLDVAVPIEHGVVTDWADVERLWQHVFVEALHVQPIDYRVLVTETPLNPRANRGKTVELLFECLDVGGAYLASQPVLALYASGRTSGLVLDCGHGVTHWVPVVEGYSLPQGIARMGYGGRDVTEFLGRLLAERGFFLFGEREREALRQAKEKLCYVASTDEEEEFRRTEGSTGETYALPDGSSIVLGSERFRCPEALFQPQAMGLDSVGVAKAAKLSVDKCPSKTVQHQLYENVVVSGGSTMFKGFKERLEKELGEVREGTPLKVVAPPNRKYAAWVGGAIVASLSTFQPLWIRREEYEEQGPKVVFRKCF